jgi:hypothetical protein
MVSSAVETPSEEAQQAKRRSAAGALRWIKNRAIFRKSGHRLSAENATGHGTESMIRFP